MKTSTSKTTRQWWRCTKDWPTISNSTTKKDCIKAWNIEVPERCIWDEAQKGEKVKQQNIQQNQERDSKVRHRSKVPAFLTESSRCRYLWQEKATQQANHSRFPDVRKKLAFWVQGGVAQSFHKVNRKTLFLASQIDVPWGLTNETMCDVLFRNLSRIR